MFFSCVCLVVGLIFRQVVGALPVSKRAGNPVLSYQNIIMKTFACAVDSLPDCPRHFSTSHANKTAAGLLRRPLLDESKRVQPAKLAATTSQFTTLQNAAI
jgi:hypothetical protein